MDVVVATNLNPQKGRRCGKYLWQGGPDRHAALEGQHGGLLGVGYTGCAFRLDLGFRTDHVHSATEDFRADNSKQGLRYFGVGDSPAVQSYTLRRLDPPLERGLQDWKSV